MAILKELHWECIPQPVHDLMAEVGHHPFAQRFYLAGGTALALQLGHRISVDLDFFSATDELPNESRREIVEALRSKCPVEVLESTVGNLLLRIRETRIGFFSYGYALLEPTFSVLGVEVASLLDIGMMKLDALISRGARKDFYDLYFIAQHIPIEEMLRRGPEKYPYAKDYAMMALISMTDFTNADRQAPVETFPSVLWGEIKAFFISEARRLGREWFGLR